MSSGSFKTNVTYYWFTNYIYIYIYIYLTEKFNFVVLLFIYFRLDDPRWMEINTFVLYHLTV